MNPPIRVLIIDDSALARRLMSDALHGAAGVEVVGAVADPLHALERVRRDRPDVVMLDIDTPRVDGIGFLRRLMAEQPTPVIACSASQVRDSGISLRARAAGAVSVVAKPVPGSSGPLPALVAALRMAACRRVRARCAPGEMAGEMADAAPVAGDPHALAPAPDPARAAAAGANAAGAAREPMAETCGRIIALGTSTGGTQALEVVLRGLPLTMPGIVVVQHMPEKFTALFAQRLNHVCALEVLEAQDGQRVLPGRVLIAPGGRQMAVRRSGAQYLVEVSDGPPVNRHRPSVDVLFRSVAKCAGRNALGVIMTGMGDDGARGLREMFDAGAQTIAQDEASSVVFGMPREAIKRGAAGRVLALQAIAPALEQYARGG